MIDATFQGSDVTVVLDELKTLDARALEAAARGMRAGLRAVVRIAQVKYLSGPRPQKLGVVSGVLRGSLVSSVEVSGGKIVARFGSDVPYAAYHEHGFHGTIQVRTHRGNRGAKRGLTTVEFTRAHQRKVNYAGRPFLRPALEEGEPIILEEIRKALAGI
jgi:phage gpG-like protein